MLKSNDVDLEMFLGAFIEYMEQKNKCKDARLDLNLETVTELIESMDTEWDKKVARVILGANHSRSEIDKLGMDSEKISNITCEVMKIMKERIQAKVAAEDMVKLRLKSKFEKLTETVEHNGKKIEANKGRLNDHQLEELIESNNDIKARIDNMENLIEHKTSSEQKKSREMVSRTQQQLIKENRLGHQKVSTGRPVAMDEEDEQFVAKCIENKATAHGMHHDSVMYMHHRVKELYFLKLVNYNHVSRGLPTLKSASTVYDHSKPKTKEVHRQKTLRTRIVLCKKAS